MDISILIACSAAMKTSGIRGCAFTPGTRTHTEWNSERICSLPRFPDMTETDVDDVVNAVKKVLADA